jgi:kinesin family member 18/19
VRPFNAKELPQVTSLRDAPLYVGDGSLAAAPLPPRLSTKGIRRIVQVVDERVLVFDPPEENPIAQYSKTIIAGGRKTKDMRYAFDRIFDETCSQEDVFTHTARPLLDSVLDGFNATVFAYGATGCGKTHTIRFEVKLVHQY